MSLISRSLNELLPRVSPFKSQKGQDLWVIFKVHPFKKGGYFVDLASADGIRHSNTYVLEKHFGWKGICIEPNPKFLHKLKKNRTSKICEAAVDNHEGLVQFRIDNKQLGGIVSETTDNNYNVRGDQLKSAEIIEVKSKKLQTILDEHKAPRIINYFSLDVEGSEEAVISSFDFDKYSFDCLTIERPTSKVNKVLFDNGYVFVKNYRFDTFYVHNRHSHKLKLHDFEQIPKKDW